MIVNATAAPPEWQSSPTSERTIEEPTISK